MKSKDFPEKENQSDVSNRKLYKFSINKLSDTTKVFDFICINGLELYNYTIVYNDNYNRIQNILGYSNKRKIIEVDVFYSDTISSVFSKKIVSRYGTLEIYLYNEAGVLEKIIPGSNNQKDELELNEVSQTKTSTSTNEPEIQYLDMEANRLQKIEFFNSELLVETDCIILKTFPSWILTMSSNPESLKSSFIFINYKSIPEWFQFLDFDYGSIRYVEFKNQKIIHSSFNYERISNRYIHFLRFSGDKTKITPYQQNEIHG